MATTPLLSDAELLAMGIAADALAAIPVATRDVARAVASSFALSFLRKRFTLPLVSWSDDIKRGVAHIAAYDLLSKRGFGSTVGADEAIEKRYLQAVDWFKNVAKGLVEPEDVVDSTPTVAEAGPLMASEETRWGPYGSRR